MHCIVLLAELLIPHTPLMAVIMLPRAQDIKTRPRCSPLTVMAGGWSSCALYWHLPWSPPGGSIWRPRPPDLSPHVTKVPRVSGPARCLAASGSCVRMSLDHHHHQERDLVLRSGRGAAGSNGEKCNATAIISSTSSTTSTTSSTCTKYYDYRDYNNDHSHCDWYYFSPSETPCWRLSLRKPD